MVAVGFTVIDPLALSDANDPGVMTMVVAPVVTQLSVAASLVPTVPGLAVNDEIVGLDMAVMSATGWVQPARKMPAKIRRTGAQIPRRDGSGTRMPGLGRKEEDRSN